MSPITLITNEKLFLLFTQRRINSFSTNEYQFMPKLISPVFRSLAVFVVVVVATNGTYAEEPDPRPPDRSWNPIWAGLEVNNKWLLDSNNDLANALSRLEAEHNGLVHDVDKVSAEVESLDLLLEQMEAQRANYRKRLAELYRTNLKLREKLLAKPK